MTDTAKQIIPDPNLVIRCLDPEMLEALKSHGTFIISELLEEMKKTVNSRLSHKKLSDVLHAVRSDDSYGFNRFYGNISESIDSEAHTISYMLIDGKSCSLLQPDGSGWQKGKLKICFEFIPEETESEENNEKPIQTDRSPI